MDLSFLKNSLKVKSFCTKIFCKKQEGWNVLGGRTLVVDIGSFCPQKKEHVSLPQYSAFKNEKIHWEKNIHRCHAFYCMDLSYTIGNMICLFLKLACSITLASLLRP